MLTRKEALDNYKLSVQKKIDDNNNEVIGSIVQQEIINHNNSILATNQAINELREKFDKLNESTENRLTELESKILDLGIDFNNILNHFNHVVEKFDAMVKEQNDLHEKDYNRMTKLERDLEILFKQQKAQGENIDKLEGYQNKNDEMFDQLASNQQILDTNIKHKVNSVFEKLKEAVLNQPSKEEAVRKEFSEELLMYKLDAEGIFKEIEYIKRNAFITEKKIEDLYTHIVKRKS
jgi:hypothetical protein